MGWLFEGNEHTRAAIKGNIDWAEGLFAAVPPEFALIGLVFVAWKVFSFVRLLVSLFVLPGTSVRSFGPKGSWAVVTGASDGIGKEFSNHLARAGFNILLVSRTQSKLDELARAIQSTYKVQTKTFAMDYAQNRDGDYEKLTSIVSSLDVSILVNNVGKSHDIPVTFAETTPSEVSDIINVNCFGTLRTTALVIPGMMSRKRGLILTMGSFGGLLPTPFLATYSGSKAFLQQWSSALANEMYDHNITVQLVQSYLVTSAMSKIRRPTWMIPKPKSFVGSVLKSVGRSGGAQGFASTSTPYWSHGLMQWVIGTFTGYMNEFVVERNAGFHAAIRKRALRKRERDAKRE